MPLLTNIATVNAAFGLTTMHDTSEVTVEIPDIKVNKTCDAVNGIWIGDVLTYTIIITNIDETVTATDITFEDTIDPDLARLIVDSVYVGGQKITIDDDFTYDTTTGTLNIPNPLGTYTMPNILPGTSNSVTFRVTKA